MVHPQTLCAVVGAVDLRELPRSHPRERDLFSPRLRVVWLPVGSLSTRKFLARRNPALDPVELLRPAVSRAMEHPHALSTLVVLPAAPVILGARRVLPGPSFSRR